MLGNNISDHIICPDRNRLQPHIDVPICDDTILCEDSPITVNSLLTSQMNYGLFLLMLSKRLKQMIAVCKVCCLYIDENTNYEVKTNVSGHAIGATTLS